MLHPIRFQGLRDPAASWYTIWNPSARALAPGRCRSDRFSPRTITSPEVGRCNPTITRPSVVLPQPDSPTMPSTSPSSMVRFTSSTARTTPPPWPRLRSRK